MFMNMMQINIHMVADPTVPDVSGAGHQLDPWVLLEDYPETYLYTFFGGVRVTQPRFMRTR